MHYCPYLEQHLPDYPKYLKLCQVKIVQNTVLKMNGL